MYSEISILNHLFLYTVYGTGVLGSLENGYLVGKKDHEGAERYYQYCTAFPVGTALAQSWNKKLMEQFGRKVAAEMEEFHINLWLAPGLNIHRNPLCGRNFEYYSEDPFLAGTLAAAVTRGVQSRPGLELQSSILHAIIRKITEWGLMHTYQKGH